MDRNDGAVAPPAPQFPQDWPRLGLGCAPLGDLFRNIGEEEAAALLAAAWDAGIRYYDTAPWYGHGLSEHRLGALLRQHDRADWRISTKVGRVYDPAPRGADARIRWQGGLNFSVQFDYSAEGMDRSVRQSQMRLGQPTIDALVIHDLDRAYHGEAFEEHAAVLKGSGLNWLNERKAAGEISAIGMGINEIDDFEDFSNWIDIDFFIVAMPYSLLDQTSLHGPMKRCLERGIKVVIGAPFASGLLTDPNRPGLTYGYQPASEEIYAKARKISAICQACGVPLMAAALQFPLLHPAVVSVIPGAETSKQVRQNAENAARAIPPELWTALKAEGLIDEAAPTGG